MSKQTDQFTELALFNDSNGGTGEKRVAFDDCENLLDLWCVSERVTFTKVFYASFMPTIPGYYVIALTKAQTFGFRRMQQLHLPVVSSVSSTYKIQI